MLFLLISILAIAPLLVVSHPPLHDYPFHLARVDILGRLATTVDLQTWYGFRSFLVPNVGLDILFLALERIMPIEQAGRVLVRLTLVLLLNGTLALPTGALTAWYVDTRVPVLMVFLLIASISVKVKRPGATGVLVVLVLCTPVYRSVAVTAQWRDHGTVINDVTDVMSQLPRNAALFNATTAKIPRISDVDMTAWQPPLPKIVSLASVQRSVFAAATYADPVKQPLGIKPAYQPLYDIQTRQPFTVRTLDEFQQMRHKLVADVEGLGMPSSELYLLLLYPNKLSVDDALNFNLVAKTSHIAMLKMMFDR